MSSWCMYYFATFTFSIHHILDISQCLALKFVLVLFKAENFIPMVFYKIVFGCIFDFALKVSSGVCRGG